MDWFGNRHDETYIYKKVSWNGWIENEEYDSVTSGSVELSSENSLVATGSFEFNGFNEPDVKDLIRIYYSFKDDLGEQITVPIGTFFMNFSDLKYLDTLKGMRVSGSVTLNSTLMTLEDDVIGRPYTVKSGSNPIYVAKKIIANKGLNVNYDPCSYTMTADHTFSADETYLSIVNYLLELASYRDAYPDAYGTVQLRATNDNITVDPKMEFVNDNKSIMYPEIEKNNDWQDIPNVYRLLYNTDVGCISAESRNLTGSKTSLDKYGGREIVSFEEVSDVGTTKNIQQALMKLCDYKLRTASCDTEYIKIDHGYYPIYLYDFIKIKYSDFEWTGRVNNMSISLASSTKTQTKIVKTVYNAITIESKSSATMQDDSVVEG